MTETGALRPVPKAAVFLAGMAGALIIGLKPALLSSYVSHAGINEIYAGYLVSVEVFAALTGTLIVAIKGHVWDRRRIVVTGLMALLAGNMLSAFLDGAFTLGSARLIAGLGEGLTTGLFAAVMAGDPKPDRQFGLFTIILLLLASGAYRLVPIALEMGGMPGFFAMLCIPAVLALILSPACPRRPLVQRTVKSATQQSGKATTISNQSANQSAASIFTTAVLVFGVIAYYLAAGGVWPYMGQIGMSMSLSAEDVAKIFASSQVWGAVAAIIPMVLVNRIGRTLPIVVSVSIGAVCLLLIILNYGKTWVFSLASQAFMFGWLVFFPYLMGLTSSLDPLGRLSSLIYTIQNIGFFLGPIIAAQALLFGGYQAILWFGVLCFAVTLVSLGPLAFKLDRRLTVGS